LKSVEEYSIKCFREMNKEKVNMQARFTVFKPRI